MSRRFQIASLLLTGTGLAAPIIAMAAPAPTIVVRDARQLAAAIERLRSDPAQPWIIELAAGVYHLEAPLPLDERASGRTGAPTIIRGPATGTAVLSGGRALTGLIWTAQGKGIWRARVTGPSFALLWKDGRRLVRARYPNYDAAALPMNGVAADATSPERVRRWADPAGGVLHAMHASRWGDMHFAILGKNPDGTLRYGPMIGNNRPTAGPSATERYVENIREELDAGNEWFLDAAAGWLYYKPADGERPSGAGFVASRLEQIAEIVGRGALAHDIRLERLTFRYTEPTFLKTTEPLLRSDWKFHRGGAVLIENARDVAVDDGVLDELGGNGVVVSGHARHVAVRRNEITRIGASAVAFVGRSEAVRAPRFNVESSAPLTGVDRTPGPKSEAYPADSLVEDNLIHDNGFLEKQSAGVEIAMSARISVVHNSIYHLPRAGINIGDGTWGGHRIEGNDVFDTVRETGDHGSFNSWGRDRFWDGDRAEMDRRVAAERSLVALDAREQIVIRHNRWRCDHGWDIDLDDGSSNYLIEDNLLLAGGLKLREGFDRIARNNIMVNNTFHPHVWFPGSADVFEHNIVMAAYQPIRVPAWGKSVDYNLFPDKAALERAQGMGTDRHSTFGDPRFVAPAKGDFSVKPGSPALRIGFRNFAMDDFGVRTPGLRAKAARPVFPDPILAPAAGRSEAPRSFAGMTIKTVETLGEQSASGLPRIAGVLVLAVEPGGPAAAAGLQPGDVILSLPGEDGEPAEATDTAAAFVASAQGRHWRGTIPIEIFRNQQSSRLMLAVK